MKHFLSALLSITLTILMSACSSNALKRCYACNEPCPEINKFCQNCGANLIANDDESKIESERTDYSNFGFQNNYGMNEWLEIDDYNFSDPKNSYILVSKVSGYYVKIFENGYYSERYFGAYNDDPIFEGDISIGDLHDAYQYRIINNYLIELQTTNHPTWEIKVTLESGIPIIYNIKKQYKLDPIGLIPTNFIDWTREIEYYDTVIKYYIKSSYFES